MSYKTLMVHLNLAEDNSGLLKLGGAMAARFESHVIGIAACQPIQTMVGENVTAGEVLIADRAEIKRELVLAEKEFHTGLAGQARSLEWRCDITYGPLSSYIARQARAADIILSGPERSDWLEESRKVRLGDLALEAGRPLLRVPDGVSALKLNNVIVGCKESREARRAAADALPLLKLADHVTVMESCNEAQAPFAADRTADMANWLKRHGIKAEPFVAPVKGLETQNLQYQLANSPCDLFVAGAYGHSRLGEFVFGGVTRDILLDAGFCVLMSH